MQRASLELLLTIRDKRGKPHAVVFRVAPKVRFAVLHHTDTQTHTNTHREIHIYIHTTYR